MQHDVRPTQEQQDEHDVRTDTALHALRTKTPAQVAAYVENNVNSLADAKALLVVLAKAVAILARKI